MEVLNPDCATKSNHSGTLSVPLAKRIMNNFSEDPLDTPLPTPNLADYDEHLLELAHQLDADRREMILQFAQDLLSIPCEPELESTAADFSPRLLH
jgi:hypothetical protein